MIYLSLLLLVIFIVLAINHLVFAFLRIVKKKDGFSYVPVINGLIGALGLFLYPEKDFSAYLWVPFAIDWGCLPLVGEILLHKIINKYE